MKEIIKKRAGWLFAAVLALACIVSIVKTRPASAAANITRLYGNNRYETAEAAADALKPVLGTDKFDAIVVANGEAFPDALSGTALAVKYNAPIILSYKTEKLMNSALTYIKNNLKDGGKVFILGGTGVIPESFENSLVSQGVSINNIERCYGPDRYSTNIDILEELDLDNSDDLLVATGANYADCLSASATGMPILLVSGALTDAQREYLNSINKGDGRRKIYVLGGTGAVNDSIAGQLWQYGDVERVYGTDRYLTSTAIAAKFFNSPTKIFLAYAHNFPDGISAGPLAAKLNAPILLTREKADVINIDINYRNTISLQQMYVMGGTTVVTHYTATAIYTGNEVKATNTPTPKALNNAPAGSPYAEHGRLSVSGTKIVDQKGQTFVIKGVSTHGINWFPSYVNKSAFQSLRDSWGVNTVRLAMYTAEYNGYCSGGNQTDLKNLVYTGVDAATELGMYVIVDWHVLNDDKSSTDAFFHTTEAKAFFDEVSKKYKNNDNVIYEICNEPNGNITWAQIKSYASQVIPVIRANDPNAIIAIGTTTWSQDVDVAANSPITGYSNLVYSMHFYAATHTSTYRDKLKTAIGKGLPVLITEFGLSEASGSGTISTTQGDSWMATLDLYGVGRVCWNLSSKDETSSLLKSSTSKTSGWSYSELSGEGQWLVKTYGGSLK